MLMQNFGVTNKEHYGMFWYFLEWLIVLIITLLCKLTVKIFHDQGSWQVCVILTYVQDSNLFISKSFHLKFASGLTDC